MISLTRLTLLFILSAFIGYYSMVLIEENSVQSRDQIQTARSGFIN
ncbi:hypothetical protein RAC89_29240 [Paenibacillus sp. GD4]|jgi:hypothetical protein|nr:MULTISPECIES: hypothetical protein [Paenibacillus]MDQ1914467.1 hypothetical protein [Paenibacillus sp. GD4]